MYHLQAQDEPSWTHPALHLECRALYFPPTREWDPHEGGPLVVLVDHHPTMISAGGRHLEMAVILRWVPHQGDILVAPHH